MIDYTEEQLISMLEGRFAVPKPLRDPLDSATDPAKELERKAVCEEVAKALSSIGDQEAMILRLRFGLGGETPMTLGETAVRAGLSREHVRQVEERALIRLRRRLSLTELAPR